jgi:hypothetical protein
VFPAPGSLLALCFLKGYGANSLVGSCRICHGFGSRGSTRARGGLVLVRSGVSQGNCSLRWRSENRAGWSGSWAVGWNFGAKYFEPVFVFCADNSPQIFSENGNGRSCIFCVLLGCFS